jgi:hypothetical protein
VHFVRFQLLIFRALPMTRALRPQGAGSAAEGRPLLEDIHFSDVWNDAQLSRTAFARSHVEALVRQIHRALVQRDAGIAVPCADRKAGTPDVF